MGIQFWWFYEVIAGAILLVCMFLCGRKGVLKSVGFGLCCICAVLAAYLISGAVSDTICKNTILDSNAKKMEKTIDEDSFLSGYVSYLNSMGYSVKVDSEKVKAIVLSEGSIDDKLADYLNNVNARPIESDKEVLLEKIREGYAVVIADIVDDTLNKYAAETAAETIRHDSSTIPELFALFNDGNVMGAARYIAKNYTFEAYRTTFMLGSFVVLFVVFTIFFMLCVIAVTSHREQGSVSAGSHLAGGLFGIISAIAIIFVTAAVIRLWAVMGNDEMLFFNNDAIDKTYVFKYFYQFAMKL